MLTQWFQNPAGAIATTRPVHGKTMRSFVARWRRPTGRRRWGWHWRPTNPIDAVARMSMRMLIAGWLPVLLALPLTAAAQDQRGGSDMQAIPAQKQMPPEQQA